MKRLMMLLALGLLMGLLYTGASAQSGGPFNLDWSTIDGGGNTFSTGGTFKVGGTVGQPDAAGMPLLSGGSFSMSGGFWFQRCTGDVNLDGVVNDADLLIVLFEFGNPGPSNADLNDDGTVNDADLLVVLFNFGSSC